MSRFVFVREVDAASLGRAVPVLEDLPEGELARDLSEERLGTETVRLADGRWAVSVVVDGLPLLVAGDDATWTILRAADVDEADATALASKLHAVIGTRHSEWDSDR